MRKYFIALCLVVCSCASVKKSESRTESSSQHTDSSLVQKEQSKTTTITETAGMPVYTRSDSAAISGYLPADDTTGFSQEVIAGAITLKATVTPRHNGQGQTTGYDITGRAVKTAEVITAPVNRQTTITETGKVRQQAAIHDKTTEITSATNKTAFRFNMAGAIAVVLCLLGVVTLYLAYRYFKK